LVKFSPNGPQTKNNKSLNLFGLFFQIFNSERESGGWSSLKSAWISFFGIEWGKSSRKERKSDAVLRKNFAKRLDWSWKMGPKITRMKIIKSQFEGYVGEYTSYNGEKWW